MDYAHPFGTSKGRTSVLVRDPTTIRVGVSKASEPAVALAIIDASEASTSSSERISGLGIYGATMSEASVDPSIT